MVDAGDFREDLYYRLYVIAIQMPPLRDRRTDIPLLVNHYLATFNEENEKQFEGLTPDALDLLSSYEWPGNVRELRNLIERMVVMARGPRLTVRDIPIQIRESTGQIVAVRKGGEHSLQEAERTMIQKALKTSNGNRTRAAELLGISRRTLHRKINEYGLRDTS